MQRGSGERVGFLAQQRGPIPWCQPPGLRIYGPFHRCVKSPPRGRRTRQRETHRPEGDAHARGRRTRQRETHRPEGDAQARGRRTGQRETHTPEGDAQRQRETHSARGRRTRQRETHAPEGDARARGRRTRQRETHTPGSKHPAVRTVRRGKAQQRFLHAAKR